MERHFTIRVDMHNDHAALQRILLTFSRRRLRIQGMHFYDLATGRPAELQLAIACSPERVAELVTALRAIVEVSNVWSEEAPSTQEAQPSTRLAAA